MTQDQLREQMQAFVTLRRNSGNTLPYAGTEDLLLRHGQAFTVAAAPPPVTPVPRACMYQSYRLATRPRSPWIYCEGMAACKGSLWMAVHHAWVVHRDNPGELYDVAWSDELQGEERAYIGLPIQASYVRECHRRSKRQYMGVLDDWWDGYRLLSGTVPVESVIWTPGK